MNAHVRDVLVDGHQSLIPALALTDPDDSFAEHALASYGIGACHPDLFLVDQLNLDAERVCMAMRQHRASPRNLPKTVEEYLVTLVVRPSRCLMNNAPNARRTGFGGHQWGCICLFKLFPWHQRGEEHPAVAWVQSAAKKQMELLNQELPVVVFAVHLCLSAVTATGKLPCLRAGLRLPTAVTGCGARDLAFSGVPHYTTHNTSATVEFREHEIESLADAIHRAMENGEGYISAALLARFDAHATFLRLPFEPVGAATYQRLQAEGSARRRNGDFFDALRQHDGRVPHEAGPTGCDSDKCMLPLAKPEN